MPLVTVTVRKPKSAEFKSAVLAAVHQALVAAGVPEKDRFQPEDFAQAMERIGLASTAQRLREAAELI